MSWDISEYMAAILGLVTAAIFHNLGEKNSLLGRQNTTDTPYLVPGDDLSLEGVIGQLIERFRKMNALPLLTLAATLKAPSLVPNGHTDVSLLGLGSVGATSTTPALERLPGQDEQLTLVIVHVVGQGVDAALTAHHAAGDFPADRLVVGELTTGDGP